MSSISTQSPTGQARPDASARRWRVPAAAAAAVVAVGATVPLWWPGDESPREQASCAGTMEMGALRYVEHGELLRVPRPGRDLGAATILACLDVADRAVRATALPSVEPTEAVLADGSVWVAEGEPAPADLQVLSEPVRCRGAGTQTLGGAWVSVHGDVPEQDGALQPPYVALVQADTGEALPLETWSSVRVKVRVTARTVGGSDPELVRRTLQGGAPLETVVTCAGGRFVASSLALGG